MKATKHYLFSELKDMYLKGDMRPPASEGMWLIFYMSKEAKELGEKGLTFATWEDFVGMVELNNKKK